MPLDTIWSWLLVPLEIVAVDVLLGADNAILIALACRSLPRAEVRSALIFGSVVAVMLRIVLTLVAGFLLSLAYLRLAGALVLIVIAVSLVAGAERVEVAPEPGPEPAVAPPSPGHEVDGFARALGTIVVADALMSLDNVVALGTIAAGNVVLLALGLMLSVPIVFFGSWIINRVTGATPGLVLFGGVLLGWVAGGLAVSDPALSAWVAIQAPALVFVVPALAAAFVLTEALQGRRPVRPPRPQPAASP